MWCIRRRSLLSSLPGLALSVSSRQAAATTHTGEDDRWFLTSDGVRLHYLESGAQDSNASRPVLLFIPGWTMPAWIWAHQIRHFARTHRVLALDPRSQGRSQIARDGHDHARRAADIAELLAAAGVGSNRVLIGWSLAVLECLQFLHDQRRDGLNSLLQGLVLVDNSVGVGEPPRGNPDFFVRLRQKRQETVRGFVKGMFRRPIDPEWVERLTADSLKTPLQVSLDLLRPQRPREFWRDALYATREPVLYAYTSRFSRQGEIVRTRMSNLRTHLFPDSGHALFVDDAAIFNEILDDFLRSLREGAASPPR